MAGNWLFIVVCLATLHISCGTRVYGNYSGDILLAAFFPIHRRVSVPSPSLGNDDVCGEVQEEDGIQAMEAFYYTLDKINRDPVLLKGFQLGAVILDSCDDETHALEQAVDLIRVLMTRDDISNLPFRCTDGSLPGIDPDAAEFHKVVGVQGGSSSSVSIQLASLLKLFQLPQVSYLSTSPDLSSQEKFPFFKRTVPSDSYQARAIIELLVEFEWTYVSLIYEDSNYGTKGQSELEKAATDYGVCFAYTKMIDFDDVAWGPADYEAIIKDMTEKDRSKVAVLWADFPRARELFLAAHRLNKTDIVWVGSDGWSGRKLPVADLGHVVRNAVAVQPLARKLGGFDQHFTGLNPVNNKKNPWFTEFWEEHFNCKFPDKPGKTTSKPPSLPACTGKEEIGAGTGYQQQLSLHFVSDAALAFAHALSDMHNDTCHGVPGLCDDMKPSNISGPDLLSYLGKVKFTSAAEDEFRFVRGVDGPPRYSVMSYRELRPAGFMWVEAGTYYGCDGPGDLELDEEFRKVMSVYPPISCSVPCGLQQARTYVKGERCCWACSNCSDWAVVVRIAEDQNDECVLCPPGFEPNSNMTWCTLITPTYMNHRKPTAIISMAIAFILIMIASFTASVFTIYYNTPVVKASGRELSFILIGVIMVSYLSTFIFVAQPSLATCSLTRILLGLCYTGIYTSILAKASRISRIFNDGAGSPKRARMTSPRSQLLIIGSLLTVEVLVLAIWFAASPPRLTYTFPRKEVRLQVCSGSEDASYMIALVYPFLLMLACLVYAFKTRKTPAGFNETRLIAFTAYTTVVIWIAFVPLYFINVLSNDVRVLTLCLSLMLNATVALLCLLAPKIYVCLFRPEKNTREAVMTRTQSVLSSSSMPHPATGDAAKPPDSPGGNRRASRSSIANQTWQTGDHDHSTLSSPTAETPLKTRTRTNSGTQTTFCVAFYAPVYEVGEDEQEVDDDKKQIIKTKPADPDVTSKPQYGDADVNDVTLEFPVTPDAKGTPYKTSRRVSIVKVKELPGIEEDSSTT